MNVYYCNQLCFFLNQHTFCWTSRSKYFIESCVDKSIYFSLKSYYVNTSHTKLFFHDEGTLLFPVEVCGFLIFWFKKGSGYLSRNAAQNETYSAILFQLWCLSSIVGCIFCVFIVAISTLFFSVIRNFYFILSGKCQLWAKIYVYNFSIWDILNSFDLKILNCIIFN